MMYIVVEGTVGHCDAFSRCLFRYRTYMIGKRGSWLANMDRCSYRRCAVWSPSNILMEVVSCSDG